MRLTGTSNGSSMGVMKELAVDPPIQRRRRVMENPAEEDRGKQLARRSKAGRGNRRRGGQLNNIRILVIKQ